MFPISAINEPSATLPLTPLTGVGSTAAALSLLPDSTDVSDVSSFGQLLSTLTLTQRRLRELAAAAGTTTTPGALATDLDNIVQTLAEAFNAARNSPAANPLADALQSQQSALADLGIELVPSQLEPNQTALAVDRGVLQQAFLANPQTTLAALSDAATAFTDAAASAAPAVVEQNPNALLPDTADVPGAANDLALLDAFATASPQVQTAAQREATLQAQVTAQQQDQARIDAARAEQARQEEQRLQRTQEQTNLANQSQQARLAAERLQTTREVANAQLETNELQDTQQQRLAGQQAATARQLSSSREEDAAAQALSDRLDTQRRLEARQLASQQEAARLVAEQQAARQTDTQLPGGK